MNPSDYRASAMVQASVAPVLDLSNLSPVPFIPYMVSPGNLLSYTPEAIDATMEKLAGISQYFETIIYPSAQSMMDAQGDTRPYIIFAWSIGGATGGSYQFINGSTTTKSFNVEATVNAGYTWGIEGGMPFIGGMKITASISFGAYGNGGMKWTTSTQTQWGITGSANWGPPYWGSPSDPAAVTRNDQINPNWQSEVIAAYKFALFYLPDPAAGNAANLASGYWVLGAAQVR
jgi:hypothetical protein